MYDVDLACLLHSFSFTSFCSRFVQSSVSVCVPPQKKTSKNLDWLVSKSIVLVPLILFFVTELSHVRDVPVRGFSHGWCVHSVFIMHLHNLLLPSSLSNISLQTADNGRAIYCKMGVQVPIELIYPPNPTEITSVTVLAEFDVRFILWWSFSPYSLLFYRCC